jgi:hypothetical protein
VVQAAAAGGGRERDGAVRVGPGGDEGGVLQTRDRQGGGGEGGGSGGARGGGPARPGAQARGGAADGEAGGGAAEEAADDLRSGTAVVKAPRSLQWPASSLELWSPT